MRLHRSAVQHCEQRHSVQEQLSSIRRGCTMMRDRLGVVTPLLQEDGASLSASTRRNELSGVRTGRGLWCDNHIEELIWTQATANSQLPNYSTNHEYVEVYARDRTVGRDRQACSVSRSQVSEMMELVAS